MKNHLTTLATMAVLACAGAVSAANTNFMKDSAIAEFKDADVTLLLSNIDQALAQPEGTTTDWKNPRTGANGRITTLEDLTIDGRECRALRVENHARGRNGKADWHYCRGAGGRWELMPN
jgi:surface antigen